MPVQTAPGVYFEALDRSTARVGRPRTDVAAIVGVCERGPLDAPVRVTSWEQFRTAFGNLIANGLLPWAVKAFFDNGGQRCWVVRVAAPAVQTSAKGAQPPDRLSSVVQSTDGFAGGAAVTISQDSSTQTQAVAQPADRLSSIVASTSGFPPRSLVKVTQGGKPTTFVHVVATDAAAKTLYWDRPLDAAYDLTLAITFATTYQVEALANKVDATTLFWSRALDDAFDILRPMTFASGASPASGKLLDARNNATLRVEAASPGAWGNELRVVPSRASAIAVQTAAVPQPADRKSSFVESVAGIAKHTVMRVFQAGVPDAHRIVASVDPSRRRIVWSTPLDPALNLAARISFESVTFSLAVYESGRIRELFHGLTMVSDDKDHFAPKVIENKSRLIRLFDEGSPSPVPDNHPDPQSTALEAGGLALRGGRDGIAALRPIHFTGTADLEDRHGLRAVELVDEAAILLIPDLLIERVPPVAIAPPPPEKPDECLPAPPPPPPVAPPPPPRIREQSATFTHDEIFRVQTAMIEQCERLRDRFALIDPPNFRIMELTEVESWRKRFETKFAALYFPWVVVPDPLSIRADGTSALRRALPPSGHVAGVYARSDLAVGVHKAPANEELSWAQDVTLEVTQNLHEVLNPLHINAIRVLGPRGLRVYGARTLSSDPTWRYVNVRRLMSMIEEALDEAMQWAVFEPNDAFLRDRISLAIASFLEQLWRDGMLAGATTAEAFYVRCNADNNPPDRSDAGQLLAEVGVAVAVPAEYVVVRIGRTDDTLEITEPEGVL